VAMLRRHITGLGKVTIIQGPFGLNPMTASGSSRLYSPESVGADHLIDAPDALIGQHQNQRFASKREIALGLAKNQDEDIALMLHGDLLPVLPMDEEMLIGGSDYGARVMMGDRLVWTWAAYNVDKCRGAGLVFPPRVTWRIGEHSAKPLQVKCHDGRMMSESEWDLRANILGERPKSYGGLIRFEWCEPGWLHVDKVSTSATDADSITRWLMKMGIVRGVLDHHGESVSLEDPSKPATGLKWDDYSPAHAPPQEQSEGFDEKTQNPDCANRGEESGEAYCATCKGHVKIKLFTCTVHGQCHRSPRVVEGVKSCIGCADAQSRLYQ